MHSAPKFLQQGDTERVLCAHPGPCTCSQVPGGLPSALHSSPLIDTTLHFTDENLLGLFLTDLLVCSRHRPRKGR